MRRMERILLDIAYERGVITRTPFTRLVPMAVVTTLRAVPFFNRVDGRQGRPGEAAMCAAAGG